MSDLLSPTTTATSKEELLTNFTPNPDLSTYQCDITGSRCGSSDTLPSTVKVTSFEISIEEGHHCEHPETRFYGVRCFKVTARRSNVLEIQIYGQYFDIVTAALGASWAGRWILFRQGYWLQLLQTGIKRNKGRAFRLINAETGWYMIGGSCCNHATRVSKAELQECWTGRLLLAESDGGWRRLVSDTRWSCKHLFMRKETRLRITNLPESATMRGSGRA